VNEDMAAGIAVPSLRPCYLSREQAVKAGVQDAWDGWHDDDIIIPLGDVVRMAKAAGPRAPASA
jgi:hypothetical protein